MATNKPRRSESSGTRARTGVVKASVLGGGGRGATEVLDLFLGASEDQLPGGVLTPPYDFKKLYTLFELSSILRPNVDAYVTNIESFGHHFLPTVDLASKGVEGRVADAMLYERLLDSEAKLTLTEVPDPTPEETSKKIGELRRVARLEYAKLKSFFAFVCPTVSFTELRRRMRQDLEVLGNAFWEVTRNALGELAHFYYVNPLPMRLCVEDEQVTTVDDHARVTDITWRTVPTQRLFRRYVKVLPKGRLIYFKEFGDPRIISRQSGKYYASVEALNAKEPKAQPATEIIHFLIFTPDSAYGIPRWIANLPAVLGSRELDEVNLNYFKNNVVPPLALLCSGGRFGKGVSTKIEEFIDEHLKGKKGINRILVLEAEGQKAAGDSGPKAVPKIQFVPLRDVQQTDALFQEYDMRNEEKVAKSFRLPRILRGEDKQLNRATAFAALKFAEEEVFQPEREQFDSMINRRIYSELNITFWIFRSNAPIVRDPEAMATMVENLVKVGVFTLTEAREICTDIFNRAFTEVSEDWTNKPLPYVLAQLKAGMTLEDLGIGTSPAPIAAPEADSTDSGTSARPKSRLTGARPVGSPLLALGDSRTEESQ